MIDSKLPEKVDERIGIQEFVLWNGDSRACQPLECSETGRKPSECLRMPARCQQGRMKHDESDVQATDPPRHRSHGEVDVDTRPAAVAANRIEVIADGSPKRRRHGVIEDQD